MAFLLYRHITILILHTLNLRTHNLEMNHLNLKTMTIVINKHYLYTFSNHGESNYFENYRLEICNFNLVRT